MSNESPGQARCMIQDAPNKINSSFLYAPNYFVPTSSTARSLQSCQILCDPIDGSPPGSHSWDSPGKNMEWVAISFYSA